MTKKSFVIHPLLLALYAILAPLAANLGIVGLEVIKTLVVSLALASVVIVGVRMFIRDKERAGLVASALILGFFAFGHVEILLSRRLGEAVVVLGLLLAVWISAAGAWTYYVLRKLGNPRPLTNYLNLLGLILLVFPLYAIATYTDQTAGVSELGDRYIEQAWRENGVDSLRTSGATPETPKRDIYYLILDSYTRADVLQEVYAYDNHEFLQALEARGFYVAENSVSNYTDTIYSMASALNMAHIHSAPEYARTQAGITDEGPLKEMVSAGIRRNQVSSFLKAQGYSTVVFNSSYDTLNRAMADHFEISPKVSRTNAQAAFDLMLLDSSVGKLYFKLRGKDYTPLQSMFDDHREKVLYTFENLAKYAEQDGEYFVYAHVVSPHAPYVFGPNGEPRRSADPFTLLDTEAEQQWSPDLYRDQVIYINKLVIAAIDELLARSDPDPIIIIQADHGSRSFNAREMDAAFQARLLFPILNAYYLPETEAEAVVYPEISPVNTFRLILNRYFGTQLPRLEDTSYIIEQQTQGWQFVDACTAFQVCAEP